MQWNDRAIMLSVRRFAEHGAVATMFSREHGLYAGVAKAALSKSQRGIYQPGNLVVARWSARLAEHIGTWQCELEIPLAAWAMQERRALLGLNAVCALIPVAMHERDPHPRLFDVTETLLSHMAEGGNWEAEYIRFELCLLIEAGFGLDFSVCAATGQRDDLIYVSPKSGCAVSAAAGEPYKERLLPLPAFLRNGSVPDKQSIAAGLQLSGYFLEHALLAAHGGRIPAARQQLVDMIKPAFA